MKNKENKKNKQPFILSKKKQKKQNAKRIKMYIKFIKDNYDWDYEFILDLLRFKIKMVRKCIEKDHLNTKTVQNKMIAQMLETEHLLQKVISFDYKSESKRVLQDKLELQKADLKKAFEMMTENIWNWWD